jgi:hypothetical protein
MVGAFKVAIDSVRKDKSSLSFCDKKQILETFIENDDVLGQLLDFISLKN